MVISWRDSGQIFSFTLYLWMVVRCVTMYPVFLLLKGAGWYYNGLELVASLCVAWRALACFGHVLTVRVKLALWCQTSGGHRPLLPWSLFFFLLVTYERTTVLYSRYTHTHVHRYNMLVYWHDCFSLYKRRNEEKEIKVLSVFFFLFLVDTTGEEEQTRFVALVPWLFSLLFIDHTAKISTVRPSVRHALFASFFCLFLWTRKCTYKSVRPLLFQTALKLASSSYTYI